MTVRRPALCVGETDELNVGGLDVDGIDLYRVYDDVPARNRFYHIVTAS